MSFCFNLKRLFEIIGIRKMIAEIKFLFFGRRCQRNIATYTYRNGLFEIQLSGKIHFKIADIIRCNIYGCIYWIAEKCRIYQVVNSCFQLYVMKKLVCKTLSVPDEIILQSCSKQEFFWQAVVLNIFEINTVRKLPCFGIIIRGITVINQSIVKRRICLKIFIAEFPVGKFKIVCDDKFWMYHHFSLHRIVELHFRFFTQFYLLMHIQVTFIPFVERTFFQIYFDKTFILFVERIRKNIILCPATVFLILDAVVNKGCL